MKIWSQVWNQWNIQMWNFSLWKLTKPDEIGQNISLNIVYYCGSLFMVAECSKDCNFSLISVKYHLILLKYLYIFIRYLLKFNGKAEKMAYLILKCLMASLHSLSSMKNEQNLWKILLKPFSKTLWSSKNIVLNTTYTYFTG